MRLWSLATSSAVLLLSFALSQQLYALNCDGQTYHSEGIRLLLHAWNPIWGEPPHPIESPHILPFSKGPWLVAAALIRLTGDVEAGTAADLLLLSGVAAAAIHVTLSQGLSLPRALLIGGLAAANPVALNQLWSYYVDGQLASLVTLMLLIGYDLSRNQDSPLLRLLPLVVILLVNVKLSGLIFAVLLGLAVLAAVPQRRVFVTGTLSLLAAVCIGGFNPYITNIRRYHNPIYPLHHYGSPNPRDPLRALQIRYQTPVGLQDLNRMAALAYSIWGRCDNRWDPANLRFLGGELKIPGTFTRAELACFMQVDTRVCGWGPLTGLIVLSTVVLAAAAPRPRRANVFLLLGTALSILIVPDLWWARFVPQLWVFPTALTAAMIVRRQDGRAAWMVTLLALNLAGVFGPYLYREVTGSERLRQQLAELAAGTTPVQVAWGGYSLNQLRFEQWKIPHKVVEKLPVGTPMLEGQILLSVTRVRGLSLPALGNHPHATSEADLARIPGQ